MAKGKIKINTPPPPTPTAPQPSTKYSGVKHTIMIMSGKGGVGKSTFSVNLAVSLGKTRSVGIIDADINGPDDPMLLGVSKDKLHVENNRIIPLKTKFGVDLISMAFFLPDENTAVIWRGALRHKAIQQFLEDATWSGKDYVIIVVTPQELALLDARKAINFAEQLHLKVLGIVENMSGFSCPHCGTVTDIFKTGGAEALAKELGIEFLGKIPIYPEIVQNADTGVPAVVASDDVRNIYEKVAEKVVRIIEK